VSYRTVRRAVVFAALAMCLALPGGAATRGKAQRSGNPVAAPSAVSFRLLNWLAVLFLKEGCRIDPGGLCANGGGSQTTTEAGCRIDPWGLCASEGVSQPATEAGCGSDPNGLCR
jgi:hypothetical protein